MEHKSDSEAVHARHISEWSGVIREQLDDPAYDVGRAIVARDIVLSPRIDTVEYRSIGHAIVDGEKLFLLMRRSIWNRHVSGRESLILLKRLISEGVKDVGDLVARMRATGVESLMAGKKFVAAARVEAGNTIIPRAYKGEITEMDAVASLQCHYETVSEIFRSHVTVDIDAVFDIGCGIGDIIAELALYAPRPEIKYFGGDVSIRNQQCLECFAEVLGNSNLRGVDFDFAYPNFGFLAGSKSLLVISHVSLIYASPFPAGFWEMLLSACPNVKFILFEPISFCLPDLAKKPLFTRRRAESFGYTDHLYSEIRRLEKQGAIEVEEIVPDISGATILLSLTLIRFRKVV